MLLVVCGPSGTGKGTLVRQLVEGDPQLSVSRSWTTRPRRRNEPRDAYTFVDRAEFEERIAAGGFLEWAEVFGGHLYGTPAPEGEADLVLEIDVQGAEQVRERVPEAVVVLLLPPDAGEQERRLMARDDTGDQLAERLARAPGEEARGRRLADHVIVNDDLSVAVAELAGIVADARARRR